MLCQAAALLFEKLKKILQASFNAIWYYYLLNVKSAVEVDFLFSEQWLNTFQMVDQLFSRS